MTSTDDFLGAATGLLALGLVVNVAGKAMSGFKSVNGKGNDFFSSKSESFKSKGGKSIW